jgi:hypothetical protein
LPELENPLAQFLPMRVSGVGSQEFLPGRDRPPDILFAVEEHDPLVEPGLGEAGLAPEEGGQELEGPVVLSQVMIAGREVGFDVRVPGAQPQALLVVGRGLAKPTRS